MSSGRQRLRNATLILAVVASTFAVVPAHAADCDSVSGGQVVFCDSFDGNALDAGKWEQFENGGSISVSGGRVTLTQGFARRFPYVRRTSGIFPTSGSFTLYVGFQYLNAFPHGVGMRADQGPPSNGIPLGPGEPIPDMSSSFVAWQDSAGSGSGINPCGQLAGGLGTNTHTAEFHFRTDVAPFLVLDGSGRGSCGSAPRPSAFWFGNPSTQSGDAEWTDIALDLVRVEIPPPPPPENRAPTACFTASTKDLSLVVNGTCSSDPDPGDAVVSYDWDWGDGTAHGTGAIAEHSYAVAGTFRVTLNVRDTRGLLSAISQTLKVGGSEPPPPLQPLLVGLGDSVAAGHGLGFDRGVDQDHPDGDNPGAYPHVLGRLLGWDSIDYAISGACAATPGRGAHPDTPSRWTSPLGRGEQPRCKDSVLSDELPKVSVNPALITVTVGANDIQFGDCFVALVAPGEDPCAEPSLTKHLDALAHNLDLVLREVKDRFSNARIVLTKYYNPMPLPTTIGDPCVLSKVGAAFKYRDLTPSDESARVVQTHAFYTAREIVQRLNDTIQQAADRWKNRGLHTQTVALRRLFHYHDICVQYGSYPTNGWIFAPSGWVRTYGIDGSRYYPMNPADRCADNFCEYYKGSMTVTLDVGGVEVPLGASWDINFNGVPHPTAGGQRRIAIEIKAAIT